MFVCERQRFLCLFCLSQVTYFLLYLSLARSRSPFSPSLRSLSPVLLLLPSPLLLRRLLPSPSSPPPLLAVCSFLTLLRHAKPPMLSLCAVSGILGIVFVVVSRPHLRRLDSQLKQDEIYLILFHLSPVAPSAARRLTRRPVSRTHAHTHARTHARTHTHTRNPARAHAASSRRRRRRRRPLTPT